MTEENTLAFPTLSIRLAQTELGGLAVAVALVAALVGLALDLGVAVVGVSGLSMLAEALYIISHATYLVAKVGVDAHELTAIDGSGALHVHGTSTVVLAVTARSVNLAVVVGVKVDNVNMAAAVVLNDLVRGLIGTSANDVGGSVALDRDGVLADILEPDELEVAGSETVDTFLLVLADDNVTKSGALLENKDGVSLTWVC